MRWTTDLLRSRHGAKHGEGLASARHPVRKDGRIVAHHAALHHRQAHHCIPSGISQETIVHEMAVMM